jgi:hypothetical protein
MDIGPKTGKKDLKSAAEQLVKISGSCFLCDRIGSSLDKYCNNIVFLWKTEPVFREKLQKQPFICYLQTADLLKSGIENLNAKLLGEFAADLFRIAGAGLKSASDEVSRFCKSFDYRYSGEDLGEAKYASEHAIEYINGNISAKNE